MRRALAAVCLLACALGATGQRTTRKGLKTAKAATETRAGRTGVRADTLRGEEAAAAVMLTGYEKPLRARRETIFVTNRDSARTLIGVRLEIEYRDMNSRTLHRRTVDLPLSIGTGETNMATFKTWDINNVFHYHVNVPQRTRSQATPYRVEVRATEAVYEGADDAGE